MSDSASRLRPEDALIEAVLEARGAVAQVYVFGACRVDLVNRRLTRDGAQVDLPPKEFETLRCLIEAGGRLVTKEQLLARGWPGVHVEDGTIANRISAIRKVLGRDEHGQDYIQTVARRGYRLRIR